MYFARSVSLAILLAFHAVSSVTINRHPDCKNEEGKCTEKDPRTNLYPTCMFDTRDWTLLCNYSNFTKIPDPDDVEKQIYESCKNAKTLDVSDSCLREIKKNDLAKYPNVSALQCRQNLISTIQSGLFQRNQKLHFLDFCTNRIKSIEPNSFLGLRNLDTLILDNNNLHELNSRMFTGLLSLKKLSIHANEIAVLEKKTFVKLRKLEVLVLTGNRISYIQEHAFIGLRSLTTLQLDGNKLSSLDRDMLASLPNLQTLSLSYNDFVVWPEFKENTLANLQNLNLGHNMLEEIKSSNIANLSKLQNLSLENNSLSVLPEDLHLHVPNLRYLNVSKNHFEAIDQFAFSKLCYLETLDLHDNRLTRPYAEWFSRVTENGVAIPNVTSGNQWKCDCDVIQYEDFLEQLDAEWLKSLQLTCNSPKSIVLHVSNVLNRPVVEEIMERYDCRVNESFVKSERLCNFTYPYPKTAPTTYQPTTKVDTTTEDSTIMTDSTTQRQFTHSIAEGQHVVTQKMEGDDPDEIAIILIALSVILLLVIIAITAVCVMRRRPEKTDEFDSEKAKLRDNRDDAVEKLLSQPPLPARVSSQRSLNSTQSEIQSNNAQQHSGSRASLTNISEDRTYMTMEPLSPEDTLPKEIRSVTPAGVRREPEGCSFKTENT